MARISLDQEPRRTEVAYSLAEHKLIHALAERHLVIDLSAQFRIDIGGREYPDENATEIAILDQQSEEVAWLRVYRYMKTPCVDIRAADIDAARIFFAQLTDQPGFQLPKGAREGWVGEIRGKVADDIVVKLANQFKAFFV